MYTIVNRWLLCLVFLVSVLPVWAQEFSRVAPDEVGMSAERLKRIDRVFQEYVDEEKMAGSVILIGRQGKLPYVKAFGYRDRENQAPMTTDAIFRIASQTKAVVSVGIMILQEQGRLLIQDPVSQYIPEFKQTQVALKNEQGEIELISAKREITLRDLLTHTAGIGYGYGPGKAYWQEAGIQGWYFADRNEPIAATIERMAKLPMDAQPGERWVYGYNTDILGVVIERASGLSLDQFLSRHIFEPLGMHDTHFYLPPQKADRLAVVYEPTSDGLNRAPDQGTMNSQGAYVTGPRKSFSGGAGLLSTAHDYYVFLQMLLNKGAYGGQRILAPSTVEMMTTDHLVDISFRTGSGFGLGFEVVTDMGKRGLPGSVGTFGWGGAYGSEYWVDPDKELVVVYFTQLRPGSIVDDKRKIRTLTYQAIIK